MAVNIASIEDDQVGGSGELPEGEGDWRTAVPSADGCRACARATKN